MIRNPSRQQKALITRRRQSVRTYFHRLLLLYRKPDRLTMKVPQYRKEAEQIESEQGPQA